MMNDESCHLESRAAPKRRKLGGGAEFELGAELGVDLGTPASQSYFSSRDNQQIYYC